MMRCLKDRAATLTKQLNAHMKMRSAADPEEWAAEELKLNEKIAEHSQLVDDYTKAYLTAFSSSHATAGLPNNIQ